MTGAFRESGAWEQALALAEEIRELAEGISAASAGAAADGMRRSAAAACAALAEGPGCDVPVEAIGALGAARRSLSEVAAGAGIALATGRATEASAIASRTDRLLDLIDTLIRAARKARRP